MDTTENDGSNNSSLPQERDTEGDTQTDQQTLLWYDMDRTENVASNNSSVAYVFIAAVTFLLSRCLATIGGYR
jgi:hypothetical protein